MPRFVWRRSWLWRKCRNRHEAGAAIFESLQKSEEIDPWIRPAPRSLPATAMLRASWKPAGKRALTVKSDTLLVSYGPNLVLNSSFEELDANGRPVGWTTFTYSGSAQHGVEIGGGRNGGNAISISSTTVPMPSWDQWITGLEPGAQYHFSAWIKTEM